MSNFFEFNTTYPNPSLPEVKDIKPEDLKDHLNSVTLIDVREPDEFVGELGHIPGATLIPLGDLEEKLSSVSPEQSIVFICRSGGRSARASAFALSQNFTSTFNMKGGMIEWNRLGLTTES